jgi:hypothetical protein
LKQRNDFRGTEAHSCLIVEGLQTNVPGSNPFQWIGHNNSARLNSWLIGDLFDVIEGITDISSESSIQHSRTLFFGKDRKFLLIWDRLTGEGTYDSTVQFILKGTDWKSANGRASTRFESGTHFTIQSCIQNARTAVTIDPFEMSPSYLQKMPASRLRFRRHVSLPATRLTFLTWGDIARTIETECFGPNLVRLQEGVVVTWCYVAVPDLFDYSAIRTDAAACIISAQNEKIVAAEAHNVSMLEFHQRPLLQAAERIPHWLYAGTHNAPRRET